MNTIPPIPVEQDEKEHNISVSNSLLQGELSAVEAYDKAVGKFEDDPHAGDLIRMRSEHQQACEKLRNFVIDLPAAPENDSGAWGTLTGAIQSAANLFGENSATLSLKQGEAMGKKAYEAALSDESLAPELKELIRGTLLPMVDAHIDRLDTIGEAMKQ